MPLVNITFFCSTPNFRGIHQYCLHLARLVNPIASVFIRTPRALGSSAGLLYRFFYQLLWELFPGGREHIADIEIFATPRLPFRTFLRNPKRKICGAVVHDCIQCIDDFSLASLYKLYSLVGFIEFLKRIVHSIYFGISLYRLDFVVFNSYFTSFCLQVRYPNHFKHLSAHSLVLHPLPSFAPSSIIDSLQIPFPDFDPTVFRIHVVTGSSPSKQPLVLEQCLAAFKHLAAKKYLSVQVNVFGYSSFSLNQLSSEVFDIECHPASVHEKLLIQSCLVSNVFLSTSLEEGFGIPLLDSVLLGLQCICTPIEPFLEINSEYSFTDNQVLFTSTCDESSVDEFVALLEASALNSIHVDPIQRASLYSKRYCDIENSSRRSLSDFIYKQSQIVRL